MASRPPQPTEARTTAPDSAEASRESRPSASSTEAWGEWTEFENKWALLVGASNYEHLPPLKYAHKDAHDLGAALIQKLDFPAANVTVIADGETATPTYTNIQNELCSLKTKDIHKNDLLIFQFAGHGIRSDADNQDYILPLGGKWIAAEKTRISVDEIVRELRATGCRHIVILLDMCRNEMYSGARSVIGVKPGVASRALMNQEGLATYFSCEPREISWEIDQLQQGAFTHCLLAAVDDENVNTVSELGHFLRRRIPEINAEHRTAPQRPLFEVRPDAFRRLPLFYVASSQQAGFVDQVFELYSKKNLTDDAFGEALAVLDLNGPTQVEIPGNELSASQKAFLTLLRRLCQGKITPEVFERRRLQIGRLTGGPSGPEGPIDV